MKAYTYPSPNGNRIELVDEYGFRQDVIEVSEVHVEVDKNNIKFVPTQSKTITSGRFV
jgi:hypothetical protein